jgi:hypothetical protein
MSEAGETRLWSPMPEAGETRLWSPMPEAGEYRLMKVMALRVPDEGFDLEGT